MRHTRDYGVEQVPLKEAAGRILAEDITADRDLPPFNRATKDGITLNYSAIESGRKDYEIVKTLAAGTPAAVLEDHNTCMEIMTGAVVPYDADTVIMYEDLEIDHGIARIKSNAQKGQNIHYRGSDTKKGSLILKKNTKITAAEIGILASVGRDRVQVKKLPRVAVISTGNELVEIDVLPEPHQIRKSNTYSLQAALKKEGITPMMLHLQDDKDMIRQKLTIVLQELDVLLLSGGVSKGKFDFIPQVLNDLGVEKVFHGVKQRPGKPFWFGQLKNEGAVVFSFPGNPVSTFANYHVYFRNWLYRSSQLEKEINKVFLDGTITVPGEFTRLAQVKISFQEGKITAAAVKDNGSGDLLSLTETDGFVQLDPEAAPFTKDSIVPFYPTKNILV